ncbi:MAG: thymidine kinase [Candidatus Gottesmanbacteria bacterium]
MKRIGYLEVIAGPMYCGKTEELIRQVKRATIGKKHVIVFKHAIDVRYGTDKKVQSHAGMTFASELIHSAKEILSLVDKKTDLVAIDEAQWLGEDLIPVVQQLLTQGKHVIVAGLAMTFDRQPFIPMPTLMAIADKVTKLSAICSVCGADAVFHKRIAKGNAADALSTDPSLVNKLSDNVYEARCRNCFSKK